MASFVGFEDLILLAFSIREGAMETETFSAKPQLRLLLDHLAAIKDTRQSWKVAYPLREVLFLVVCGTIASGDGYDDIADWGEARLSFLRALRSSTLRAHPDKRSIRRKMNLARMSKTFFYELFAHMR